MRLAWHDSAKPLSTLTFGERVNFLLTNRIPRRWATLLTGRVSRIENRAFTKLGILVWQALGGDLKLQDAQDSTFDSLQACFIRKLKPGLRPIDADPFTLSSPCDAIVGELGPIDDTRVYQAKGYPYSIEELLHDQRLTALYRHGNYVTLRLRSNFYHRFHAPAGGRVVRVNYISGDTWNVNPVALRCIERLYCRNERAVVEMTLDDNRGEIALVAVAAVSVASMRFGFLSEALNLRYTGPNVMDCDASLSKGEELGYFELGSTIIVFAPEHIRPAASLRSGQQISMGEPLFCIDRECVTGDVTRS
jgi:phosphatidylserine decarboxylase